MNKIEIKQFCTMTHIHVYLQNLVMVLWCLTLCMSCQPFFLKSVKIEAEYKEAKTMFQEKQGCSNPSSWSELAKEHEQVQDEYDHSIPRSNYAVDEGIFSEGLKEPLKEIPMWKEVTFFLPTKISIATNSH